MSFLKFKFSPEINKALEKNSFSKATDIQDKVIPLVLDGKDVMAKAQTGSGKSASFVLPILEFLNKNIKQGKPKPRVLVLTPTRELTIQIADAFSVFSSNLEKKLNIVSVIGGEKLGNQMTAIQKGCDIIVATSGRLLEILEKQQLNLSKIDFFVLDEADKMLDLGFAHELDLILKELPQKRQNLLFSATYPEKVLNISSRITKDPVEVSIDFEEPTVDTITQRVIEVNRENRGPLLRSLLSSNDWERVLVFMSGQRAADNIAAKFRKYGFLADSFHGGLTQDERTYTLNAYKAKKFRILFTTDIFSRGLHVENIDCVINFDLPRSPTDYIHRIGRTARAGKEGLAISLIGLEDLNFFKVIEKKSSISLKREIISGFELKGEIQNKQKGPAPVKGKGKSKKDKLREKARLEAEKDK